MPFGGLAFYLTVGHPSNYLLLTFSSFLHLNLVPLSIVPQSLPPHQLQNVSWEKVALKMSLCHPTNSRMLAGRRRLL